ncbi:alpha/beta fold hydrolase [Methanosarcina sp. T3]|uniref:alpha/beta fold hydrolase n=1 Tax=Methanosarcina sp. T3 TaxID=3439062 RepID=UPI003F870803
MGCSLGGETAIDFTLKHPEMVRSLIVVGTVPGGFEMRGEPPARLLEMLQALEQGDLVRVSDLQIRLRVDGSFRQPEQVDSRVRQQVTEMNRIPVENGTWAIADSNPLSPLSPPAEGRLGDIGVPVLVVAGALDNPEILRAATLLTNKIEGAKKVVIPDTAHLPNMEKPAEFSKIVLDFLSRL